MNATYRASGLEMENTMSSAKVAAARSGNSAGSAFSELPSGASSSAETMTRSATGSTSAQMRVDLSQALVRGSAMARFTPSRVPTAQTR